MSDNRADIAAATAAILDDHMTDDGAWDAAAWKEVTRAGLTTIGLSEALGGGGGSLTEAAEVVRVTGSRAARIPAAEASLLSSWLLDAAGLGQPAGVVTTSDRADEVRATRDGAGWLLLGTVRRVPYGSVADHVVVLARSDEGPVVVVVDPSATVVTAGQNLAGDPYDDLDLSGVRAPGEVVAESTVDGLRLWAAVGRLLLSAGAAQHVLDLCVRYVGEREQFGRPLGRFQVVQHLVAELAGEVSALQIGTDSALLALGSQSSAARLAVFCAKIDADRSITRITTIAHQLHGAIGATHEHALRRFTLRLWSWREEAGRAGVWADALAADLLSPGSPALWPAIVDC